MNDPLGSFFIILKFLCKVFTYSTLIKIEKVLTKLKLVIQYFVHSLEKKIPNYRLGVPEKTPYFRDLNREYNLPLYWKKRTCP